MEIYTIVFAGFIGATLAIQLGAWLNKPRTEFSLIPMIVVLVLTLGTVGILFIN